MHDLLDFAERKDDPIVINQARGKRGGGCADSMVSSARNKPFGSCVSLKEDIASVQRVLGKHLTFSLERLWCDLGSTVNCLPDSQLQESANHQFSRMILWLNILTV